MNTFNRIIAALDFSQFLGLKIPEIKTFNEKCNPFGVEEGVTALFCPQAPFAIFFNKRLFVDGINEKPNSPYSIEVVTFHEIGHYEYFHRVGFAEYMKTTMKKHEDIANSFALKALNLYADSSVGRLLGRREIGLGRVD